MINIYENFFDLIANVFYDNTLQNEYQIFCTEFATFILVALIVILPFYVVYKIIRGLL